MTTADKVYWSVIGAFVASVENGWTWKHIGVNVAFSSVGILIGIVVTSAIGRKLRGAA